MSDSITIKGIRQGILVTLTPVKDWIALITELTEMIDKQNRFFKGAGLVLDIGERSVPRDDLFNLKNLLEKREVHLLGTLTTSDISLESATQLELATHLDDVKPLAPPKEEYELPPLDSEVYGTGGVLIKQTLRSGRTVRSGGHVVIIGDVNPGAEVVAVGDIVVWGKVRGVVHAGVEGDESAVVCGLDLAPTQLRIASLITVPPGGKRRDVRPEMARIIDGRIEARTWG